MSEQPPKEEHRIPVFGVFLVFLGIVFLLQTFGVLPWGLWVTLWRFWPVLLIAVGLAILMRRHSPWLVSGLIFALLLASLGIAIWQHGPASPVGAATKSYAEPLDNLERARVEIDLSAGSLTIGSLPTGSTNFVEAMSGGKPGDMLATFQRQDGEGLLILRTKPTSQQVWNEAESHWEVNLSREIPLALEIKSAVGDLNLDLSQLSVTELGMDIDAGNCVIQMPASASTKAYIKADLANIEVTIPEGVAAKLKIAADLTALEIDEGRFPRRGDYYISPDFEQAVNQLELELDSDLGRVQIK
ncbi:MAG TPA: cytochrome d ubiquinol oxidase subunit II [Dehalococcoidia bacterium]|jgi:hypothetical protein|nr:cytochrome d ubiquinol oxidase subunit II [Dehalococcoidia bacterium]